MHNDTMPKGVRAQSPPPPPAPPEPPPPEAPPSEGADLPPEPQVELDGHYLAQAEVDPECWADLAYVAVAVEPGGRRVRLRYRSLSGEDVDQVMDRSELGFEVVKARAGFNHNLSHQVFDQ